MQRVEAASPMGPPVHMQGKRDDSVRTLEFNADLYRIQKDTAPSVVLLHEMSHDRSLLDELHTREFNA